MTDELLLLKESIIPISDKININIPTLENIAQIGENEYYASISLLCSTPSDYLVLLKEQFDKDWEEVKDYEWFQCIYSQISNEVSQLLFGFNINELQLAINNEDNSICLLNNEGQLVINESIYIQITTLLRKIHGFEKNERKAGNAVAKDYIYRNERKKERRRKRHLNEPSSHLKCLISALVNFEGFKYNYSTVWELTIAQFMDAVHRCNKIKYYNFVMTGAYSGMVDTKNINQDKINWLGAI